jgi:hypothetical protein
MEIFKIKISPEVLRDELTTKTFSANTFGYYSGLSYVLSSGTVNLGTWQQGNPFSVGYLAPTVIPLSFDSDTLDISKTGRTNYNWTQYLKNVNTGSTITINYQNSIFELVTTGFPIENDFYVSFPISAITIPFELPIFEDLNLSITQPNTSQLIDLSIPILLKQDYEDIGYYSPFDGYISQLFEEVNFTFVATEQLPYRYCIYNTSNYNLNYFQNATYTVDWGDDSLIQEVQVIIPQSFCHVYPVTDSQTTYTITFSGINSVGSYSITKDIQVPYTDIVPTNPYGTVNFISNNGSWSATPTSQNYINNYDSINTVEGQISSNYVSTPFIVSGFTQSRLNELKVYGPQPYIIGLNRTLSDGTEGYIVSQTPEYTEYIINDQTYLDFANGTSIFVVQSEGFTENTITATTITKFEYLMNVIEQPEIQSNVFIERGKYSGLENFRRIGDVNNTGALETYGYGFFDVKIYNEV